METDTAGEASDTHDPYALVYLSGGYIIQASNSYAEKIIGHTQGFDFGALCKKEGIDLARYVLGEDDIRYFSLPHLLTDRKVTIEWNVINISSTIRSISGIVLVGFESTSITNSVINKLKERIFLYENILSKLPTNVYWKDESSVYMGCNDRLAKSMGLSSRNDVIGMTDFDFLWTEEEAKSFIEFDKKVMNEGKPLRTEDSFEEMSGKRVTMLTNKTPLRNPNGDINGVLAISVDITEKKRLEKDLEDTVNKLEYSNSAKSEFIANMSHDLKTPMTGLLGMLASLLQAEEDARASLNSKSSLSQEKLEKVLTHVLDQMKEYADMALISGKRLNQFHDDVLNNVELDSGESQESVTDFNLDHLIQDVIGLQKPAAFNKKLNLTAEINEHTPCYLNGFRQSFYRILVNLISNSIKFTKEGSITVNVSLNEPNDSDLCYAGDKIALKVRVSDTGIGIPHDKFDEIFNQFSRLTPSYKGIYKGLGMGLYAVKKYVNEMKGEIRVESKVNEGSHFTVYLPFNIDKEGETKFVDSSKKSEGLGFDKETELDEDSVNDSEKKDENKKSVLLIEDDKIAGKVASMILVSLGCSVDIAESGEEAIEKLGQKNYKLIIMDIGLPGMSGIETAAAIRQLKDENKANTPIVALTGHAYGKSRQLCLNAGMQSVFGKPATPEDLKKALDYFSAE